MFVASVRVRFTMLVPNEMVAFVAVEVAVILNIVSVKLAVLNVPATIVSELAAVKSSCMVYEPPTDAIVIVEPKLFPALVMTCVPRPLNVKLEVEVTVVPADRMKSPRTLVAVLPAKVPVNPVKFIFLPM